MRLTTTHDNSELRINTKNENEVNYVKHLIETLHFIFNPTYIVYVNGVRLEAKEHKDEE